MQITFCIYNIYISYLLQVARASLRNKLLGSASFVSGKYAVQQQVTQAVHKHVMWSLEVQVYDL